MPASFFTTCFVHEARTPLPHGTTRAAAHALLQDYSFMIRLNPLVISDRPSESKAAAEPPSAPPTATYRITDRLDYLPCGLWKGELSYYADFWDTQDGMRTRVEAPLGFVSESEWRVVEEGSDGSDGTGSRTLVLVETAKVTCPRVLRVFVERTIGKSHDELGKRFRERLVARSADTVQDSTVVPSENA